MNPQVARAAGKGGARLRAKDAWGKQCPERDLYAVVERIARSVSGVYWVIPGRTGRHDVADFFEGVPA